MANINKATPGFILEGFDDESLRAAVAEPIQLPQHLPHFFLLAERGRVASPQIGGSIGAGKLFGLPTFDLTSKYATHGTLVSNIIAARGNQQMYQRLITPLGKTAMIRLSLEMIPCQVPLYERNSDGSFKVDSAGNYIQQTVTSGNTVTNVSTLGHRLVWHADLLPYTGAAKLFGGGQIISDYRFGSIQNANGQYFSTVQTAVQNFNVTAEFAVNVPLSGSASSTFVKVGGGNYSPADGNWLNLTAQTSPSENGFYQVVLDAGAYALNKWNGTNPVSSTVYPIVDLEVDSFGDWGNRVGLQIEAANLKSINPGNVSLMDQIGAFLYRLTCVERPTTSTTPLITKTAKNAPSVSLCFQDNIYDSNNNPLSFTDVFIDSYQFNDDPTVPPTWGPFGRQYLYHENLAAVLDTLINGALGTGDSLNSPLVVAQNVAIEGLLSDALWNAQDGQIIDLTSQDDTTLNGTYVVNVSTDGNGNQIYDLTPWNPDKTDQVNTVGEAAFDKEAAQYGRSSNIQFTGLPQNAGLLNIFTGVDQNGVPYFSFDASSSVAFGGVAFGAGRTIYATGGDDGLPIDQNGNPDRAATFALYDLLVNEQVTNYGDLPGLMFRNIPKYPTSTVWDTGFTMATKKAMMNVMGVRADMWLGLCSQIIGDYTGIPVTANYTTVTVDGQSVNVLGDGVTQVATGLLVYVAPRTIQAASGLLRYIPGAYYKVGTVTGGVATMSAFVLQPANTADQDNANALVLTETVAQYPESTLHGTAACRAIIVGRAGKLRTSSWRGIMSLVADFADKVAAYMGAGDGRWKSSAALDSGKNNIVKLFKDVNVTWRDGADKDSDWTNNLIYVEDFDTASLWYPAIQTVTNDDSSVLNSFLTMAAACYCWKIQIKAWQNLPSGTTQLSPGELIQKNNGYMQVALKGIFDNRFIAEVRTWQDPADLIRGYSYKSSIKLLADEEITVADMVVILDRNDGTQTIANGVTA